MKRMIVAVLTGVMIITVTGCAGTAGTASNTAAAETETVAAEAEPAAAEAESVVAETESAAGEEAAAEETAAPEAKADTAAEETAGKSGSLPAYRYPGDDPVKAAVYNYIVDEYAGNYEKSDVSIPYVAEVYIDKSNEDDVQVFGEFWIDNYDLEGDTLKTASGGEYPGIIHIKKDGDTYTVTKVEVVEDGSEWTNSAKKIFGTHFDDFIKIKDDTATRDKVRAQIIKEYADANDLDIKAFQDYGWDPVKLSE